MRLLVAVALLAACRGGRSHHDAGHVPASAVSAVPKLPKSPDGVAELQRIDAEIALAKQPFVALPLVLARAGLRGRLEDYQDALARSAAWLAERPDDPVVIRARVQTLTRVHKFAEARALLAKLPAPDAELTLALDEATGQIEKSLTAREASAKAYPSTTNLVMLAGTQAVAGDTDGALATMSGVVASLHDHAPELFSWVLFQWGRIYELKGDLATAKDFFAEAHRRLPGYLEATAHLAQAMAKTGDTEAAKKLVEAALAQDRHPELLGLAVQLGHPELLDEAKREWERYVTALPEAFSDHAARFYLTVDPARALVLARANLANRDTSEARALVAEAALAAGDPAAACDAVAPLVTGKAPKAQRFIAWRALAKCGRKEDADRLARDLGITQ
jgi:tetratricopeptide (TPR) repeat protein